MNINKCSKAVIIKAQISGIFSHINRYSIILVCIFVSLTLYISIVLIIKSVHLIHHFDKHHCYTE